MSTTAKVEKIQKWGKNQGRNVKWESEKKKKKKKKKKKPVSASYGRASSSYSSDFLEDSMKEHKTCWRKGKETLAKWLKEGEDTRGFAIEGKGKGEAWRKEGEGEEAQ